MSKILKKLSKFFKKSLNFLKLSSSVFYQGFFETLMGRILLAALIGLAVMAATLLFPVIISFVAAITISGIAPFALLTLASAVTAAVVLGAIAACLAFAGAYLVPGLVNLGAFVIKKISGSSSEPDAGPGTGPSGPSSTQGDLSKEKSYPQIGWLGFSPDPDQREDDSDSEKTLPSETAKGKERVVQSTAAASPVGSQLGIFAQQAPAGGNTAAGSGDIVVPSLN